MTAEELQAIWKRAEKYPPMIDWDDFEALLAEVTRLRDKLAAETQDRERVWRECEVMSAQQLEKTREIARLRAALEAVE